MLNKSYVIIFTVTDKNKLTFYKLFHHSQHALLINVTTPERICEMREYAYSKELEISWSDLLADNYTKEDLEFIFASRFNGTLNKFKERVSKLIVKYNKEQELVELKKPRVLMVIHLNGRVSLYNIYNVSTAPNVVIVLSEIKFKDFQPLLYVSEPYIYNQILEKEIVNSCDFQSLFKYTVFGESVNNGYNRIKSDYDMSRYNSISYRFFIKIFKFLYNYF